MDALICAEASARRVGDWDGDYGFRHLGRLRAYREPAFPELREQQRLPRGRLPRRRSEQREPSRSGCSRRITLAVRLYRGLRAPAQAGRAFRGFRDAVRRRTGGSVVCVAADLGAKILRLASALFTRHPLSDFAFDSTGTQPG